VQFRVQPTRDLYFTAAVISGNRNPCQQDKTGLTFVIKDSRATSSAATKIFHGGVRYLEEAIQDVDPRNTT
jgi:hypothetical protein